MKHSFNKEKAFGVELELLIPRSLTQRKIVELLQEAGVDARLEGYGHETVSYWKMTTDCTVKALGFTFHFGNNELVSPKLYGDAGKKELKKVLEILNDADCRVNKSCGTHVHHDVTDVMLKPQEVAERFLNNLIKTVIKYEHLIYRLIAPSRLKKVGRGYWTMPARKVFGKLNSYNTDISLDSIINQINKNIKTDCDNKYSPNFAPTESNLGGGRPNWTQNDRYCGLNLQNIWTRGSVEFRYHQGTLNFEKLWAWIVFTQAFVNVSEINKSVNFKVQKDQHGMFHLRKAIGFIGSKDRCDEYKFANKVITRRFKEMTTAQMNRSRSTTKYYYTIKEQLKRGI